MKRHPNDSKKSKSEQKHDERDAFLLDALRGLRGDPKGIFFEDFPDPEFLQKLLLKDPGILQRNAYKALKITVANHNSLILDKLIAAGSSLPNERDQYHLLSNAIKTNNIPTIEKLITGAPPFIDINNLSSEHQLKLLTKSSNEAFKVLCDNCSDRTLHNLARSRLKPATTSTQPISKTELKTLAKVYNNYIIARLNYLMNSLVAEAIDANNPVFINSLNKAGFDFSYFHDLGHGFRFTSQESSLLHIAIFQDKPSCVHALLNAGISPDYKDKGHGEAALKTAAQNSPASASLLVDAGADFHPVGKQDFHFDHTYIHFVTHVLQRDSATNLEQQIAIFF